jgi:hypothetical protein
VNRERNAHIFPGLQVGNRRAIPRCQRSSDSNRLNFLFDDRVGRPDELGLRHVVLDHQPLQDSAELSVPSSYRLRSVQKEGPIVPEYRARRLAFRRSGWFPAGT